MPSESGSAAGTGQGLPAALPVKAPQRGRFGPLNTTKASYLQYFRFDGPPEASYQHHEKRRG